MKDINKSEDLTLDNISLQDIYRTMLEEKEIEKELLPQMDIIKMQKCMEEIIHGDLYHKDDMNGLEFHEETREIMYAKDCVDNEFAELLRMLPFKNWKIEKWKKMTELDVREELEKNGKNISMELIDLWFFFAVMNIRVLHVLGLPLNEKSIKMLYAIKWLENVERVNTGAFDKKRDMTEQELDMLERAKEIRDLVVFNRQKRTTHESLD